MIRNLKGLGVALIAVFAMSAIVASAASASEYTAQSYPVTATGTQPAGSPHLFTVGPRVVSCPNAHFEGSLTGPSSSLTITPTYSGVCSASGLPATVTLGTTGHKCDYLFHAESTTASNVDIVCETGNDITVDVWASKAAHEEKKAPVCEITIDPQTGLKSVSTKNTETGSKEDVDVTASANLTATVKGNTLICGTNGAQSATYKGEVTLQGKNNLGEPVGIMVGD